MIAVLTGHRSTLPEHRCPTPQPSSIMGRGRWRPHEAERVPEMVRVGSQAENNSVPGAPVRDLVSGELMNRDDESNESIDAPDRFGFRSTRWSQVAAVRLGADEERRIALSDLCQRYWPAVFAYIRCRGYREVDAQDMTQAFFADVLSRDRIAHADQARGSFRSFLKTLVRNFLVDDHRAAAALKRGGEHRLISMEPSIVETMLVAETDANPETRFERAWATEVLRSVLQELEREHQDKGRGDVWEAIRPFLTPGAQVPPYESLQSRTGLSVTALKVAVHRARERFREVLRRTVADTLPDEQDVDGEIVALMRALKE